MKRLTRRLLDDSVTDLTLRLRLVRGRLRNVKRQFVLFGVRQNQGLTSGFAFETIDRLNLLVRDKLTTKQVWKEYEFHISDEVKLKVERVSQFIRNDIPDAGLNQLK